MASRFMTDPHAMRDMAGRFEVHAQTVEDEARRMWASAQNISGAGWSGMAEATSLDTMRSNSRLPTTLNARDQPPAEVSDQRVSGLTGAVQSMFSGWPAIKSR